MDRRRVVVTGMGVVSALGLNQQEFWEGLRTGRSGIRPIEGVDTSDLPFRNGAQVQGFQESWFDKRSRDLLDRFAQLLLLAAREAWESAGLELDDDLRRNVAVVTGSCLGGKYIEERSYSAVFRENRTHVPPLCIPRAMANAGASHLTLELGITGPAFTLSTACSSSAHAIGLGYWMVQRGMSEAALVGGSEAPFTWASLKAWDALRIVSPNLCRPFSRDRQGLILGEGGGVLLLETLEHALARSATIHAEIVGFGMSADAYHVTKPSAEGASQAMSAALADADLRPDDIDYINAHGTGTRTNDATETQAIRQVFGQHADRLAVSSTKSMHGHTLGAAGALECIATVLALRHGVLPPTINFTEADLECDLDVVPNTARGADISHALSSSFAFGGLNAVLALRRWEG